MISESVYSKLENILFHNWTTLYRIVSISTTCWRKFINIRFAKFCSVLKSICGDSSLAYLSMTMTSVNNGMCREPQIRSEKNRVFDYITQTNLRDIYFKKCHEEIFSALHFEKYRKVRNWAKNNAASKKLRTISKNRRGNKKSLIFLPHFPHIVRRVLKHPDCEKGLRKICFTM